MYLCYIDESGDTGSFDVANPKRSGSPYYILAGLIVHSNKWKISLENIKAFRKKIAREAYLKYDVEFHCSELIDPHKIKEYNQLKTADRWKLIEEFAETIGLHGAFTVIIDKASSKLAPDAYLTESLSKFYKAYDEFLKKEADYGIVFYDRSTERHINTHVRKLLGTGASGETSEVRIGRVIEDPIFRLSHESMFIQAADVIAYTLKEKEFPQASRKKFNADRIFERKLLNRCFRSGQSDDKGIVRFNK